MLPSPLLPWNCKVPASSAQLATAHPPRHCTAADPTSILLTRFGTSPHQLVEEGRQGCMMAHSLGGCRSPAGELSSPRRARSWSPCGRPEVARLRRSRPWGLRGVRAGTEAMPPKPRPGGRGARGRGRGRARGRRAGPLPALPPARPPVKPGRRPRPGRPGKPYPKPPDAGPLGAVSRSAARPRSRSRWAPGRGRASGRGVPLAAVPFLPPPAVEGFPGLGGAGAGAVLPGGAPPPALPAVPAPPPLVGGRSKGRPPMGARPAPLPPAGARPVPVPGGGQPPDTGAPLAPGAGGAASPPWIGGAGLPLGGFGAGGRRLPPGSSSPFGGPPFEAWWDAWVVFPGRLRERDKVATWTSGRQRALQDRRVLRCGRARALRGGRAVRRFAGARLDPH